MSKDQTPRKNENLDRKLSGDLEKQEFINVSDDPSLPNVVLKKPSGLYFFGMDSLKSPRENDQESVEIYSPQRHHNDILYADSSELTTNHSTVLSMDYSKAPLVSEPGEIRDPAEKYVATNFTAIQLFNESLITPSVDKDEDVERFEKVRRNIFMERKNIIIKTIYESVQTLYDKQKDQGRLRRLRDIDKCVDTRDLNYDPDEYFKLMQMRTRGMAKQISFRNASDSRSPQPSAIGLNASDAGLSTSFLGVPTSEVGSPVFAASDHGMYSKRLI